MKDKDKNNSSYLSKTFPSVVPSTIKTILTKSDGGTLQHYFKNYDKDVLINTKPAKNQVVNIPNNKVMSFKGQILASST